MACDATLRASCRQNDARKSPAVRAARAASAAGAQLAFGRWQTRAISLSKFEVESVGDARSRDTFSADEMDQPAAEAGETVTDVISEAVTDVIDAVENNPAFQIDTAATNGRPLRVSLHRDAAPLAGRAKMSSRPSLP